MPLTFASPGERNTIKRISGKDDTRRHLANLGLNVGEDVTVVSQMGGNVIINIKESRIALDKSMANRIFV